MTATIIGLHPGARCFTIDARREVVAEGPFCLQYRGDYVRESDLRDTLAALLYHQGLAECRTAGGGHAATCLGYAYPTAPLRREVREISDLGHRGDRGEYADLAALSRALLGEEGGAG